MSLKQAQLCCSHLPILPPGVKSLPLHTPTSLTEPLALPPLGAHLVLLDLCPENIELFQAQLPTAI